MKGVIVVHGFTGKLTYFDAVRRWLTCLLILLPIPALIYPALVNGFPLLYSDSGTYLIAGFEGKVPIDRPILYPLFIKWVAGGRSIWLVPIVQALLVSLISYLFLKHLINPRKAAWVNAALLIMMAFATGLSNFCSQVMPDVFTGLIFFVLSGLFIFRSSRLEKGYWLLLILFLAGIHNSHVLILLGLISLFLIFYRPVRRSRKGLVTAGLILVLLTTPTMNKLVEGEFYYSKSSAIFLSGSLVEMGLLDDFLQENCPTKTYYLCQHQDHLGEDANQFIWTNPYTLMDSACNERGGWTQCWKEKNDSLKPMLRDFFTTPNYLGSFVKNGLSAFGEQLLDFGIGHLTQQAEGSAPSWPLQVNFASDLEQYRSARQYKKDLFFETESQVQWFTLLIGMLLLILTFIRRGAAWQSVKPLLWLLLGVLLVNALVCGVLSNPVNRYQGRIIWLIPYLGILAAWLSFFPRWLRKENKDDSITDHTV